MKQAIEALRRVSIPEPERRARQYPHEFSGGMAQRAMIAMASLICQPSLLILDEPTTGLDVTIQSDIMELIVELSRTHGLTTCLITHDLGVVAETCEEVVVMNAGRVVETGSAEAIFTRPHDALYATPVVGEPARRGGVMLGESLLQVRDLRKVFPVEGGRRLVAVDGVNLEIAAGETLALVGESGSGKSTVARCIVRLIEPSGGDVVIGGDSILGLQPSRLAGVYRSIQMVFQDPNASLNPRMSVRQVLDEPLMLHLYLLRSERAARVKELIEMVGLTEAHLDRYPHELSGGQRQRVGIARAIAVSPVDRHPRRADLLARCLGARPDPRSVARPPGAAEPRLSLHQPRPAGGPACRRPRRRHVSGRHRRDRADPQPVR